MAGFSTPTSRMALPPASFPHQSYNAIFDSDSESFSDFSDSSSYSSDSDNEDWPRMSLSNAPPRPRGYQLELLDRALRSNIIACLETGAGKTLIASLVTSNILQQSAPPQLSRSVPPKSLASPSSTHLAPIVHSAPSAPILSDTSSISALVIFIVPRIPLVAQQASVLRDVLPPHLRVGEYSGERNGIENWSSSRWAYSLASKNVLVMTAQICLNILRRGLLDMTKISLLVVDEAHNATKNHPYRRIFLEFYHSIADPSRRPHVFGMTATPVKTKSDASAPLSCVSAIAALEATLDATVVTVSESSQAQVESLVPKPDEFILEYSSLVDDSLDSMSTDCEIDTDDPVHTVDTLTASDDHFDSTTLNYLSDVLASTSVEDMEPTSSPSDEIHLSNHALVSSDMRVIMQLHRHLGLTAAHLFATHLCAHRALDPRETLRRLQDVVIPADDLCGGIRDKCKQLLDLLFQERCRVDAIDESLRAIVFVRQRSVALALAALITAVFAGIQSRTLMARAVVGAHSPGDIARFSQASLIRYLAAFQEGKFGVLVATNVVEEGVDVPACGLVVAFDAPLSPTAYVQARGRARKRGAKFVALVDRERDDDRIALGTAREGARVMSEVTRGGPDTEKLRLTGQTALLDQIDDEPVIRSRRTSARVYASEAVSLLYQYAFNRGSAVGLSEQATSPKYVVSDVDNGMRIATVELDIAIGGVIGYCQSPQSSIIQAKRNAALDAYRKLYEAGEVDEYLMVKQHRRGPKRVLILNNVLNTSMKRKKRAPEAIPKALKKHTRLRNCLIVLPAAFQSPDSTGGTGEKDSAGLERSIKIDEQVEDKVEVGDHATLSEAKCAIEEGEIVSEEATTFYLYSVTVDRDMSDMEWHSKLPVQLLGLLIREKIPDEDLVAIQCPEGEPVLTLCFEGEARLSKHQETRAMHYVRSIQLCILGRTPGRSRGNETFEKEFSICSRPGFFLLPTIMSDPQKHEVDWFSIDRFLSYGWLHGPLEEDEVRAPKDMAHRLVCSSHEGMEKTYIFLRMDDDVKAESYPNGFVNSQYDSFCDYFLKKFDLEVNPMQPMVSVASVRETMTKTSTSRFMLPSELIRVIPIHPIACYVTCILPEVQTFFAFRKCWRRNRTREDPKGFLGFARALQPNVNNVSKENSQFCYERLEFLGDSVLKVIYSMVTYAQEPEEGEGFLSDTRDIVVSNQTLADIAIKMKLPDCLAFSGISKNVKRWPWLWGTQRNSSISLSEKVLADCVEALIGCEYEQGGLDQAVVFLEKLNLVPNACETLAIDSNKWWTNHGGVRMSIPPMGRDQRHFSYMIREVEERIGYSFTEKRHLMIALTHGSYTRGRLTYQRYEYLGDAVIGFLILSHFYYKYPHLDPGWLTFLRAPALSNDLFARAIVKLGIHRLFWHNSEPLMQEILKFEDLLRTEDENGEDVSKKVAVPKVLGDLLESIIGAIVVDKGMRLDGIMDIALRMLGKELDRFANPNKFERDAISQLHEILQGSKVVSTLTYDQNSGGTRMKTCRIMVGETEIGVGSGSNKRVARRMASMDALRRMKEKKDGMDKENNAVGSFCNRSEPSRTASLP